MTDAFSVPFGAAIGITAALVVILVDWERLRARARRGRRRGMVVLNSVPVEGGLNGLGLGVALLGSILVFVACFFTGAVVISEWLWSLA